LVKDGWKLGRAITKMWTNAEDRFGDRFYCESNSNNIILYWINGNKKMLDMIYSILIYMGLNLINLSNNIK
jgi:hypothetical protein